MHRLTNLDTGEYRDLPDDIRIITTKQKKAADEINKKKSDDDFISLYSRDLGGFIFSIFKYCSEYNRHKELTQSDIVRLIILSTYIDYNGALIFDNGVKINKSNINKNILKLSKNEYYEFMRKMIKLNIIYEENKILKINKNYFVKGDIKENKEYLKNMDFTRIFINTIRNLYHIVPVKTHKHLGLLFRMIPYINKEWNIVCENPNEKDINSIKPLSFGNLLELMNYNPNNSYQIKRDLLKIKTKNNTSILFFAHADNDFKLNKIYINPQIIYGGSDIDKLNIIRKGFI